MSWPGNYFRAPGKKRVKRSELMNFFVLILKYKKKLDRIKINSLLNYLWFNWLFNKTFSKHRPSGPMLSISQNVRLSVCVSVCPFTFEVPFNGLFAPTSQSRMFNIFRDSESFGKSNGKNGLTFEHFCLEMV